MAQFSPPPTYADPVINNEKTGKGQFNPIWLKWFLDITQFVNASGGSTGGGIPHNNLTGIQGGGSLERYHLTAAQYNQLTTLVTTPPATSASAGTAGQYAYDSSYFYICVATNTWRRVAIATF